MTAGLAATRYRPGGTPLIRNCPFSSLVVELTPGGAPSSETMAPCTAPPSALRIPPEGVRVSLTSSFFSPGSSCEPDRRLPAGGATNPTWSTLMMNWPGGSPPMLNLPSASVTVPKFCAPVLPKTNNATEVRGKGAPVAELVTTPDTDPFPAAGGGGCGCATAAAAAARLSTSTPTSRLLFRLGMDVLLRDHLQIFHQADGLLDFDLFGRGQQRFRELGRIIGAGQIREVERIHRQYSNLSGPQILDSIPAGCDRIVLRHYLRRILPDQDLRQGTGQRRTIMPQHRTGQLTGIAAEGDLQAVARAAV